MSDTGNMPDTDETETVENDAANLFRQSQLQDKTLWSYWQRARDGSHEFKIFGGLLYKRAPLNKLIAAHDYLLVVPETAKKKVKMKLAYQASVSKQEPRVYCTFM